MNTCTFCKIARGKAPAYIVYKDRSVVAFLDKAPLTRGHTLVATVEHYENIMETPEDLLGSVINVVKKVAKAQLRGLRAQGVRVVQNNGSLAGQVIFHLHFHVIPFYQNERPSRRQLNPHEGEEVSKILTEHIRDQND